MRFYCENIAKKCYRQHFSLKKYIIVNIVWNLKNIDVKTRFDLNPEQERT